MIVIYLSEHGIFLQIWNSISNEILEMPLKLIYKSCKNSILMMYNKIVPNIGPNLAYSPLHQTQAVILNQIHPQKTKT